LRKRHSPQALVAYTATLGDTYDLRSGLLNMRSHCIVPNQYTLPWVTGKNWENVNPDFTRVVYSCMWVARPPLVITDCLEVAWASLLSRPHCLVPIQGTLPWVTGEQR
jgi:hypothetical protein